MASSLRRNHFNGKPFGSYSLNIIAAYDLRPDFKTE
jgi:hypothetical protein